MRAVTWHGKQDMRVETVPDPSILNPRDAIIRVTSTAICGSDLHLYNAWVPGMRAGDILGHEFMGEVVDVGRGVTNLKKGDRVVVPFPISCGRCASCAAEEYVACDNSNPNAAAMEGMIGYAGAALYGYSHLYGGYAGGQAEYVRVPYADVGPLKVPAGLDDEEVLFLTDILPTGYESALKADVAPGRVVAVWGCGPVGQFSIRSAFMLGAERVIAIDRFPERLQLAERAGAETVNYENTDDLVELLKQMTGGRGPDSCIDAVGMEAHGHSADYYMDRVKQKVRLEMDRANVLRQAIQACGKGGTVSVIGVYFGFIDKFPFGVAFGKGLTLRMGQANPRKHMPLLLDKIREGAVKPAEIISHRLSLGDAPAAYKIFNDKEDRCTKVVLRP
jgi:threonine dehydrogenase-like Zn-dependent dehydrogenase